MASQIIYGDKRFIKNVFCTWYPMGDIMKIWEISCVNNLALAFTLSNASIVSEWMLGSVADIFSFVFKNSH